MSSQNKISLTDKQNSTRSAITNDKETGPSKMEIQLQN